MGYVLGVSAVGLAIACLLLYALYVVFLTVDGWITIGVVLFFLALYWLGITSFARLAILNLVVLVTLGYLARNG